MSTPETLTLECIRDELIDALAAVTRAVRYQESRARVGDPARRQFTDKILRELRQSSASITNVEFELRRHISEWQDRR